MQFTFMRNNLVVAAIFLLYAQAGPQVLPSGQVATKNSADIRAALCDMDKGDYNSAEKKLEQLLQSDPKNICAQKLLPSTSGGQTNRLRQICFRREIRHGRRPYR
jgi:Tfp pilus assembly protein PilF